uniref:Uncharacterized protein n=1 Tax=Anguilla anguilla TaxID=7936 RepID=A0A0E9TT89_ANGAN
MEVAVLSVQGSALLALLKNAFNIAYPC